MQRKSTIVVIFLLILTIADAKIYYGKYIRHIDGDTVIFKVNSKKMICQVDGVDAPEIYRNSKMRQDSAKTALDEKKIARLGVVSSIYLQWSLIKGAYYKIDAIKSSHKHINRCIIYPPKKRGSLNEKILLDGFGIVDKKSKAIKYRFFKSKFIKAQKYAIDDRAGLWGIDFKTMKKLKER